MKSDTPIVFNPSPQVLQAIESIEAIRAQLNAQDKSTYLYKKRLHPIAAILGTIAFCGFVVFVFLSAQWLILPLLIIPVPLIAYVFYKIDKRNKALQKHHTSYMQNVMMPVLNQSKNQFTYHRTGSIFERYQPIFQESFSELQPSKSEDLLEGIVDDVPITLGEIHVDFKRRETVFCFLCFVAQFNKNIQYKTIVRSRKRDSNLPEIETTGLEDIVLENQQFNQIYQVYTENEIEARYILTPSFMEKMVTLQGNLSGNFWFQNNQMWFLGIDLNSDINLFEIREDGSVYTQAENTYMTVQRLLQLVKIFNLDSIV